MGLFNVCLPCRQSESGVYPTTEPALCRSVAVNSVGEHQLFHHRALKSVPSVDLEALNLPLYQSNPNTPEAATSYPDIVDHVTSAGSSSGPEFYVDEPEDYCEETDELHQKLKLFGIEGRHHQQTREKQFSPLPSVQEENISSPLRTPCPQHPPDLQTNQKGSTQSGFQAKLAFFESTSSHKDDRSSAEDDDTTEETTETTASSSEDDLKESSDIATTQQGEVPTKPSRFVATRAKSAVYLLKQNLQRGPMHVINCEGDDFKFAYEVWYRLGLLSWKPASILETEEQASSLEMDTSHSVKLDSEQTNNSTMSNCSSEVPEKRNFKVDGATLVDTLVAEKPCCGIPNIECDIISDKVSAPVVQPKGIISQTGAGKSVINSREMSVKKSRVAPIVTLFGDGLFDRSGRNCRGVLAPKVLSSTSVSSGSATQTSPSSMLNLYQCRLSAYKEHVATRKAKLLQPE